MAKIHLFESGRASDAERLAGLSLETVTPLSRARAWRYALPHAEPLPVLIWVARGQGRLTVEARTRGYGPGTLTVLPPRIPFALQTGTVTEGILARLPDLPEAPFAEEPLRIRLPEVGLQGELAGLLDRLSRGGDPTVPANGRAALARILLLSAFAEREGARGTPIRADDERARLAARFAHAVEDTLTDCVDAEAIALRLGVTLDRLDAVLGATCGMDTAAYRRERAMHEARRRLADTEDGPQAIAHALGFTSATQFAGAFSEAAGMTPTGFRDAARRIGGMTGRN